MQELDLETDSDLPCLCMIWTDTCDDISFLYAIGNRCSSESLLARTYVGNLDYPSFSVVFQSTGDAVTYKRVVKNGGSSLDAIYEVKVNSLANVDIKVSPSKLVFSAENKTLSYEITFSSVSMDWPTIISWSDGIHGVRCPISIKWRQGSSRDSI
uniref:Subtilisin-like protease fibronectin type-III domain-containing protein n=1 Tax=Salix viminalis TaxID=40686 RepID=A0A6N2K5U0_SALVM